MPGQKNLPISKTCCYFVSQSAFYDIATPITGYFTGHQTDDGKILPFYFTEWMEWRERRDLRPGWGLAG
jgi:hypothetical protein